ncbi:hypothetical protein TruAng_010194 [Truncatella angustata]|nr:hypothetical protein TruAng_010194 [Truncatella angustata]
MRDTQLGQREDVLWTLQDELDEWRSLVQTLHPSSASLSYPYNYWDRLYQGTTFVLHRASPLCLQPSPRSIEKCLRSAGAYLEDSAQLLRNSNVPLSLMLAQGVIFAGLTMLITAKTDFPRLVEHAGTSLLSDALPAWTRKCSVCLAIMCERWGKDLPAGLEAKFELLANDCFKTIFSGLISQATGSPPQQGNSSANAAHVTQHQRGCAEVFAKGQDGRISVQPDAAAPSAEDWSGLFEEFLGIDQAETFWDFSPLDPIQ